jgi:predicted RNA-binding Zn-ribbon protein involved in translation (DUF1610 family)
VSLSHCSYCGQRNAAKYAQVTWAWKRADDERVAFRQKLCPGCYAQLLLRLDRPVNLTEALTCPACGIETEHDYDAVYATTFVPGAGKSTFEWPLCAPCAVPVRAEAMVNAERLEDRPVGGLAQAPNTAGPPDPWAALGLVPRD